VATNGTRQDMTALVGQWERSGESRGAFAHRHGLTVWQFDYWKRRIRQDVATEPTGFAPVQLIKATEPADRGVVEVALANGERLTIRDGVSAGLLRAILSALRETC